LINLSVEKELRRSLPIWIALPIWIFNYVLGQVKISINLLKISKYVNIVIFYLGWSFCLAPILLAKILRKKVLVIVTGSESKSMRYTAIYALITSRIISMSEKINYILSDYIAPESSSLVSKLGLERYKDKILGNSSRFVENHFEIKKPIHKRRKVVGYIGRLSRDKGVMNFIEAIPLVAKECGDVDFFIGGDGPLYDEIREKVKDHRGITQLKWIPHERLPQYLNELKLLVLPSHTEGLPTILMEGMACGTPILATPVGGVPDLIEDGKTGFILKNNSPEHIAKAIIRILRLPSLDRIVNSAKKIIEEKYTFEAAVERHRKILNKVYIG